MARHQNATINSDFCRHEEAASKIGHARLRRRYRELLREEIAHTVSSPSEIEEEIRHLFVVVGG